MRVLFSTTGTGVGATEDNRRRTLESMVNSFIEKVVEHVNPDIIVLFFTEGTREMVELIKSKTNVEVETIRISDPDDFNECFEIMLKTMMKYAKNKLFVNYTYGTKTMSSAIASCAVLIDAPLICVTGERKGGIVLGGTEKLLSLEPYKFKDILTLERIFRFFNVYDFDASISEIENLRAFDRKNELKDFVRAYQLWDRFQHEKAYELLKVVRKSITFVDKKQVGLNLDFLGRLVNEKDEIEVYKKKLLDLMENARRKIDSGLYDDAVARLYRATELISQIMLREIGYGDPIYIDENSTNENDIKLLEKFKYFAEKKNGKYEIKIGLKNKIEILAEFGVEFAIRIKEDKNLWNLLNKRNKSILAHGFTPISKDDAISLYNTLHNYVKSIYGRYYNKDLKKLAFPKMGWEYENTN